MPFLFVDQLVVQAPALAPGIPGGKMRVLISVSAQWQATK
jgi:general secretion pathway protein M